MDAGDEEFSGKTVRRPEGGRLAARPKTPRRESQQSPKPIPHRTRTDASTVRAERRNGLVTVAWVMSQVLP
jgi:hypothetical protein